jgi:hypothetical protein
MDIDTKPTCAEVRLIDDIRAQGKEGEMKKTPETPILPVALRDAEITERDVETMLRVARNKNATAGRYKRTPKRVPIVEAAAAQK